MKCLLGSHRDRCMRHTQTQARSRGLGGVEKTCVDFKGRKKRSKFFWSLQPLLSVPLHLAPLSQPIGFHLQYVRLLISRGGRGKSLQSRGGVWGGICETFILRPLPPLWGGDEEQSGSSKITVIISIGKMRLVTKCANMGTNFDNSNYPVISLTI